MIDISLENLAEVLGARLYGRKDAHVSEVITDSRSIVSSPKALFFALKSERNNGHKYISELIEKGIVNFVVSEDACIDETKGVNFLRVDDTLKALHALGSYHRSVFKGRVIAVIGSNGKTVVKEWLYQLLRDEMEMIRSPKSYNSQIGVPLSLCLLDNRYQSAIIEAGISEPGEMAVLESMVKPHTVVYTSLGEAHQAYFKDRRHKALEKLRMVIHADMLIYSNDYKEIDGALQGTLKPKELRSFTWTMNGNNADVKAESNLKQGNSTRIKVNYRGQVIEYGIPFIDEASVKNSLSCMAYLLANDLLTETIRERFARLEAVEMRIEQKQGINNCLLINDYYNSDLVSLKIAVELLHNISAGRKKTVVLSDIMQSGMSDQELYKKAYEFLTDMKIDRLIGIGEHISGQQGVFEAISEKEFFNGTKAFLMQDLRGKFKDEAVLLKGSGVFKFKRISDVLELKKHRTVLEINMEALVHNLNLYKSMIPAGTKKMVMVKALSYGSGTYEIAALLQHHGIDYLGVAFADEGVKLRKAGITVNIMVMNPDEDDIDDIIDYRLEPEIYNFRILNLFNAHLEDYSGISLPIHIKLDTGMKRLGFSENEIPDLIEVLKQSEALHVQSVFSHLAGADEELHDTFTRQQIERFKRSADRLSEALAYPFMRHILNTSGIERFSDAVFDMVRIGIGLYGFSAKKESGLMNVSTLKTSITQIKPLKKGETVGYGRKWVSENDTRIAVIPVGYADGLNRSLSNGKGEVMIKGKLVPIIGNVCMDMCIIDIGDLDAEEGDEVIVFGDDYPASKIAEKLNTIPYEIISGISERVKRVYKG